METSAQEELVWGRRNLDEAPEQHLDFDFHRQNEPSTPESGLRKDRPAVSKWMAAFGDSILMLRSRFRILDLFKKADGLRMKSRFLRT